MKGATDKQIKVFQLRRVHYIAAKVGELCPQAANTNCVPDVWRTGRLSESYFPALLYDKFLFLQQAETSRRTDGTATSRFKVTLWIITLMYRSNKGDKPTDEKLNMLSSTRRSQNKFSVPLFRGYQTHVFLMRRGSLMKGQKRLIVCAESGEQMKAMERGRRGNFRRRMRTRREDEGPRFADIQKVALKVNSRVNK